MSKLETNQVDPATGTTLTLGTSGDTISIPSGVTIANSGTATGFGGANTPAFEVLITTEQTPSGGTPTKINFDSEVFDTASAYSTTDKRFTVPSGQAGKYFFYSSTCIGASANSAFQQGYLYLYKNGSEYKKAHFNTNNDGNGRYYQFALMHILDLSVGDYIEMYGRGDVASGNVEIRTAESRFGGYKIIE
jgi:hypothetical protein